MAHKIDYNKLSRIETPYGNGYAYGGRIYSDKQWKDILDFNAGGFADDNDPNSYVSNSPGKHKEISKEKFDRVSNRYLNQQGSESLGSTTSSVNQIISGRNPNKSVSRSNNMDEVNKFMMSPNIDIPQNQPPSIAFKRGGRALAAQEEAAWNKEMGIDDASVRADEAAINASKDALEQSYSDKNDAAEDDRIDRYSSASDIYNNRESSMNTAYDTAEANYAEREANPLPIRARPTVAKGFFDETGDAENAPVSLINNQTTYKKPVKKEIIKQPKKGEVNYPTRKDKTEPYVGSDGSPTTIRGYESDQATLDGYNNPESNPNIDPFISKLKESYKQPNNSNAGSSFSNSIKSSAGFKLFEKQAKIDFEKAKKQKEIDESNRAQKAYYTNPGIGNFLNSK